jgi:hypothetical protein
MWHLPRILTCLALLTLAHARARADDAPVEDAPAGDGPVEDGPVEDGPVEDAAEPQARAADPYGEGRTMAGHRFPFPQFLASSFAVSSFAVHAGFESRRVPNYPVDPSTGALTAQQIDLQTLTATQGVDGSIRLFPALALLFDFYGQARLGTNTATLLGTGADYELGGDGGLLLRLFRSERLQVSLRGLGGYHGGQHAGVTQFYQSVRSIAESAVGRVLTGTTTLAAEQSRIDAALAQAALGLTSSASGFRATALLTAAVALASYAGLQAMVGFTFDRTTLTTNQFQVGSETSLRLSETTDQKQVVVGVAADIGAASRGVPLDLVGEYEVLPLSSSSTGGVGTSSQATVQHRLALGLYYSGRPDLQLGVSAYALFAQLRELGAESRVSGKAYDAGGLFVFRYIW